MACFPCAQCRRHQVRRSRPSSRARAGDESASGGLDIWRHARRRDGRGCRALASGTTDGMPARLQLSRRLPAAETTPRRASRHRARVARRPRSRRRADRRSSRHRPRSPSASSRSPAASHHECRAKPSTKSPPVRPLQFLTPTMSSWRRNSSCHGAADLAQLLAARHAEDRERDGCRRTCRRADAAAACRLIGVCDLCFVIASSTLCARGTRGAARLSAPKLNARFTHFFLHRGREAHTCALAQIRTCLWSPGFFEGGLKQRRWRAFLVSAGPPKAGDTEEAHTLIAGRAERDLPNPSDGSQVGTCPSQEPFGANHPALCRLGGSREAHARLHRGPASAQDSPGCNAWHGDILPMMTDRIRSFLDERRFDGPCLVVDLDVVRRNFETLSRARCPTAASSMR